MDQILLHSTVASDRVDLWARILRFHKVQCMAELGVWRGEFAGPILRACPEIRTYYLVDPWRPLSDWNKPLNVDVSQFTAAKRDALAAVAFAASQAVVLHGTTSEVVQRIPDNSLDAVYIDGDHTLRGITIDLIRILPKLKLDGLLCGDDFMPDPWHHGTHYEPTLVAPFSISFAEAMNLPIFALPFHQFLIRNRPGAFSFTNLSGVSHSRQVGKPRPLWKRAASITARYVRRVLSHSG